MPPFRIACLAITLAFFGVQAAPATAATESTAAAFERYAGQFQFFGFHELLSGRHQIYLADRQAMRVYLPLLDELEQRHDLAAELVSLLRHSNPRVRVLAMASLYINREHASLGEIAKLLGDDSRAFPNPPADDVLLQNSGIGPPHEPDTVGAAADELLSLYLKSAPQFGYANQGSTAEQFRGYWAVRRGRSACASWFDVELYRAGDGDGSAVPDDAVRAVRQIRARIDALPPTLRRWTLLHVIAESQNDAGELLATAAEVDQMCADVGHDCLIRLLNGTERFEDPDLDCARLGAFVLPHVRRLLKPADAEIVRKFGDVIIASDLRPDLASKWLHESLGNHEYDGRHGALVGALWRDCGSAEADFIVEWFFNDGGDSHANAAPRLDFLQAAIGVRRPELRHLLGRIVRDRRLETCGSWTIQYLQVAVEALSQPPTTAPVPAAAMWGQVGGRSAPEDPGTVSQRRAELTSKVDEWDPK